MTNIAKLLLDGIDEDVADFGLTMTEAESRFSFLVDFQIYWPMGHKA